MTSADFSPFVVTTVSYSVSTADETSPGTTHFFLSIYLPYLLCTVPYSYRASVCLATLPLCFSLIWFLFVRPEICLHLPSDSVSRRTPLVFGYILPAVGRIRDFHPLETCAVGRTKTKTASRRFSFKKERNIYEKEGMIKLFFSAGFREGILSLREIFCPSF